MRNWHFSAKVIYLRIESWLIYFMDAKINVTKGYVKKMRNYQIKLDGKDPWVTAYKKINQVKIINKNDPYTSLRVLQK